MPWTNYFDTYSSEPMLKAFPSIKQAMRCSVEFCARTFTKPYFANFNSGPLSGPRTVLKPSPKPVQNSGHVMLDLVPMDTSSSEIPATNTIAFQINYCSFRDLSKYLTSLFTVAFSSNGPTNGEGLNIGSALSQFDDVPALFETIAESMTEAIRTSPNSTAFDGVGLNTVTYISISWGWLALPVAVVVLAFAMLVMVIVRNSNRGVSAWKSSSLALLFHELEGWGKEDLRVRGPEEMQMLAGKMAARVVDCDEQLVFERAGGRN